MTFRFFIGGFSGRNFEVVLKNDELHFYVSNYPFSIEATDPSHIVSITDDVDWQNLVAYLTDLKWKRSYTTNDLDGTQWELTFKNENVKKNFDGSNAYPPDFGDLLSLIKKITTKHSIPDDALEYSEIE